VNSQGNGEEGTRGGDVATLRDVHVDHLALLVDRPVDVGPDPGDLDVGLVDEPAVPGQVPDRPGRVNQQRCEPLRPPIEGTWSTSMARSARRSSMSGGTTRTGGTVASPTGSPRREAESSEARGHPHGRSRTASALHRATLTATVRCLNETEPSTIVSSGCLRGRRLTWLTPGATGQSHSRSHPLDPTATRSSMPKYGEPARTGRPSPPMPGRPSCGVPGSSRRARHSQPALRVQPGYRRGGRDVVRRGVPARPRSAGARVDGAVLPGFVSAGTLPSRMRSTSGPPYRGCEPCGSGLLLAGDDDPITPAANRADPGPADPERSAADHPR
jgi:hypothetical protein